MRFLYTREAALTLFAFVLGAITTGVLHAAGTDPFQIVNGDNWLTSNANYSSGDWLSLNTRRPAFGLQLDERNDMPFDRGTASATFWVHNPGCGETIKGFGEPCGWQLGFAVTQYRSVVVGGDGMEIDGRGAPYARVVNSSNAGSRLAGMVTNAFADFSGVDSVTAPSWFDGFDVGGDAYVVRRAAPGSRTFANVLAIDRAGDATFSGSVASTQAQQEAPNQWATRAQLVEGTYTFRYVTPFATTPVCVATPEGATRLRVVPSRDRCVVTSGDRHDATMIDVVVIGNPS